MTRRGCPHPADIDCPACEADAQDRVERTSWEPDEQPDQFGRTPDWNWPRGYGGDKSVPW